MVIMVLDFVSCRASPQGEDVLPELFPPNSTLEHVIDHIMYIVGEIGVEHVGLGSDFDGIFSTPEGMGNVSKKAGRVAEMLRRGLKYEDVDKIIGKDTLRLWSEADATAEIMQTGHVNPIQDRLPHLKRPGEPSD